MCAGCSIKQVAEIKIQHRAASDRRALTRLLICSVPTNFYNGLLNFRIGAAQSGHLRAYIQRHPTTEDAMQAELDTLALTVNETARELKVSRWTILKLIREGAIPVVRAGSRIIVPSESVHHFLHGQRP